MGNETTETAKVGNHDKHQAMLQSHLIAKAVKKEDHLRPERTKNFPPNSLK